VASGQRLPLALHLRSGWGWLGGGWGRLGVVGTFPGPLFASARRFRVRMHPKADTGWQGSRHCTNNSIKHTSPIYKQKHILINQTCIHKHFCIKYTYTHLGVRGRAQHHGLPALRHRRRQACGWRTAPPFARCKAYFAKLLTSSCCCSALHHTSSHTPYPHITHYTSHVTSHPRS
jgi:hypothetical protein